MKTFTRWAVAITLAAGITMVSACGSLPTNTQPVPAPTVSAPVIPTESLAQQESDWMDNCGLTFLTTAGQSTDSISHFAATADAYGLSWASCASSNPDREEADDLSAVVVSARTAAQDIDHGDFTDATTEVNAENNFLQTANARLQEIKAGGGNSG